MHRQPVLNLLRAHAGRELEEEEALMTAATIRFVIEQVDCLWRRCGPGHLTGSAWIVSPDRRFTLLTHHRKLDKWLQLGGHADGDSDLLAVARREAGEESGLSRLRPIGLGVFDLDRHWIPARGSEPGHHHYDLRFLIEADPTERLRITSESKDLAWVEINRVAELNPEESMLRMVRKTGRPVLPNPRRTG